MLLCKDAFRSRRACQYEVHIAAVSVWQIHDYVDVLNLDGVCYRGVRIHDFSCVVRNIEVGLNRSRGERNFLS